MMSRSFAQGESKTQNSQNQQHKRIDSSNIFDIIKMNIKDRELNKQYLQLRDFSNKVPYLDNFSGDPFKIVHE